MLYVLASFPRLTETYILDELLDLEAAGANLAVESLAAPPSSRSTRSFSGCARTCIKCGAAGGVSSVQARLTDASPSLRLSVGPHRIAGMLRRPGRRGDLCRVVQIAARGAEAAVRHVYALCVPSAEIAAAAAELAGVTFSAHAHAVDIFGAEYAPHLARRLGSASAVLSVSTYNVEHLRRVLPGARVELVRPGVAVRTQAPLPAQGPVLAVARFVRKKGLDVLIEGIAAASAHMPRISPWN